LKNNQPPTTNYQLLITNRQLLLLLFITLAGLAVLKYLSLHSSFFDLGIFTGLFYKLSRYGEWWRLFGGHAQPLMPIYAAVYKVLPENFVPLAVIVLQAFFLTLPGFWILKRYGRFPFLLFALYFPLWFNALFDFHMDHLAVPLLFWFYFLVEDGRYKLAVLPAVLLALVKEPFALQTASCGVWLVVRGLWFVVVNSSWMVVSGWWKNKPLTTNHKQPTTNYKPPTTNYQQIMIGLFLFLFGLCYFYLLVSYVFPALTGKKGYLSTSAFSWMGNSLREIILFITTHPLTILKEVLRTPEKFFYLVAVFGPFLFIPFLAPLYLIPAVPILAISLLSHNPNHYGYAHHYTAGLIAPIFMAFLKGLPKAERLVGGLWLVVCSKVSGWWLVVGGRRKRDGGEQFSKTGSVEDESRSSGSNIRNSKEISERRTLWFVRSDEKSSSFCSFEHRRGGREKSSQGISAIPLSSPRQSGRIENNCHHSQEAELYNFSRRKRNFTIYKQYISKIKLFNFLSKISLTTNHQLQTTNHQLLTTILCISLLFHILFSPSPLSRLFWTNKVWSYGYEAYIPTERDRLIKEAIKKYIPSDPGVAVSTQNTLNWGYLAHRRYYFAFPVGVVEPALVPPKENRLWLVVSSLWKHKILHHQQPTTNYQPIYAQYVLLDLKRPWYVSDQGCQWQVGKPLVLTEEEIAKMGLKEDPGPLKWAGCAERMDIKWESPSGKTYRGNLKKLFRDLVHETRKHYQIIYENDGFLILKRMGR